MAKVLLIAPDELPIPPVRGGSVQIYLDELLHAFKAMQQPITLLAPSPGMVGKPSDGGAAGKTMNGITRITLPPRADTYFRTALATAKQLHPDIIQVDNRPHLLPALRRACPSAKLLLNLHSTTFLRGGRISTMRGITRYLAAADTIVCNSHYLIRQVRRKSKSLAVPLHVIYPGVDHARFTGQPRPLPKTVQLLFVGRVIEQKGVHVALEALRHVRARGIDAALTIVGRTPPWEAAYGKRIKRQMRGLPVRHLGFQAPDKLPSLYQTAHVLLCPSQRNEAFGMVNVEAMATGLPVIASRVGGIPEVVDASCGALVAPSGDGDAFAQAIVQLLKDEQTYKTACKGALRRARRFRWEQTARAFQRIYDTL